MSGVGRTLVAGVDSSTQSCKVVVVDAVDGTTVRSAAVPHPDVPEVDPRVWLDCLRSAGAAAWDEVAALSVGAQQHSTILLDDHAHPVRDAILWNDRRADAQGRRLRAERGDAWWADAVGLLPAAAHPVSKLRWIAEHEPAVAERARSVLLPHDWLTWQLLDGPATGAQPTTDRSDASATGYWSGADERWLPDVVEAAFGRGLETPRVLGPSERAGVTPGGAARDGAVRGGVVVGAGLGDNAAAHLGLQTAPGQAVVSIGTSLTVSVRSATPLRDTTGRVDDMADGQGGFLPITVALNGARTLTTVARMLGVGLHELDDLAARAAPDADGVTFLPYLDGERTPAIPDGTGALLGLTRASTSPQNVARAAVLAVATTVADFVGTLTAAGAAVDELVLVGGGSASASLRQAVADLCRRRVLCPAQDEYVARGAARQAAWALTGELPAWPRSPWHVVEAGGAAPWRDRVLESRARLTERVFGG